VHGLKVVVQSLKNTSCGGASEEAARLLEEEREKLREAQLTVQGLTSSFDALLHEMERLKQEPLGAETAVRAPETLRPGSSLAGEPSFAVAVARVVLQGYSTAQAEGALREIGRVDAACAVEHLRAIGAHPEDPPTAARLGGASRTYSPYLQGEVVFPKGRPHAVAGAAAWRGTGRVRPWRGDLFRARSRACGMLTAVTGRGFADRVGDPDAARDTCLRSLAAQRLLVNREVPARLLMCAGALEAACAVLAVYRRDPEVVCAAAAVLRELTANHKSAALCSRNPKLPAAALACCAALKSNPGNCAVGVHCAGLLWGLFSLGGQPLQALGVEADAPHYLLQLLAGFPENRELVWRASGALLACCVRNAEAQRALTQMGVQQVVRECLARDPTLQYGGEFSELRPWMRAALPPGAALQRTVEPRLEPALQRMRDGDPRGRGDAQQQQQAAGVWGRHGLGYGDGDGPPASGRALTDGSDASAHSEYGAGDAGQEAAAGPRLVALQTHGAHGFVVPPFHAPPAELARAQPHTRAGAGAGAAHAASATGSVSSDGLTAQLAAEAPSRYAYAAAPAAGMLSRPAPGRAWDAGEEQEEAVEEGGGGGGYAPHDRAAPLPLSPYPERPATRWAAELQDPTYERQLQQQRDAARAVAQQPPAQQQQQQQRRQPSPAPSSSVTNSSSAPSAPSAAQEAEQRQLAARRAAVESKEAEQRLAQEAEQRQLAAQRAALAAQEVEQRRALQAEAARRANADVARAAAQQHQERAAQAEARAAQEAARSAQQARAAAADERAAAAAAREAERKERRAAAAAAAAGEQQRAAAAVMHSNAERERAAAEAMAMADACEAEEVRAREVAVLAEDRKQQAQEAARQARARAQARAEEAQVLKGQREAAAAAHRTAQEAMARQASAQQAAAAAAAAAVQRTPTPLRTPSPPAPVSEGLQRALAQLSQPGADAASLSSALRVLTKECAAGSARQLVASGGLALTVAAMRSCASDPAVCADACLVLGMVTQESDAADAALAAPPGSDGTAVSAVAAALAAHPKVMALQATASWALWGLMRGSEANSRRAIVAGTSQCLVAAIKAHAGSAEVSQSAAGALLALAANGGEAGQDAVADAAGVAAVKAAMKRHTSITFQGEFDALRDWLKVHSARSK